MISEGKNMGVFGEWAAKSLLKATVGAALESPAVKKKIEEVVGKPGQETSAGKKSVNKAVDKTRKFLNS